MGDSVLRCPLCCDRTFESKPELIEHLAIILESITCPICSNKWSSVAHLIEHLTLDNCQADSQVSTINFDISTEPEENNVNEVVNISKNLDNAQIIRIENETQKELSVTLENSLQDNTSDGPDVSRMYVEFLSKQLTKPCLQTQELKLVKDDGGISRYIFVTNDEDTNAGMDVGSAVVTKQNNDGTISLTTVRDMKMESDADTLISQESTEVEETQEEIYSCNTCGVSFTSVLDHIQNYHNDQDVVVEGPVEDMDTGTGESIPIEYQNSSSILPTEEPATDKQISRRMITETGDIIEAPLVLKSSSIALETYENSGVKNPHIKEELVDKKGRTHTRRYVVVDSVVKEIKQPDGKTGPYHKVVIKEMTRSTGEKIKVFMCMSCHVYVSSLDDFKSHPCKQLKYTCPHCPVSYGNSKSLCAHMKVHKPKTETENTPEKLFECETCSTIFPSNKSLKLHKRMHDPIKVRPIEPPVESPDGLEVSKDKFLCSLCNKLIPIDYRAVHQKSHKGKPGLNCDICNKEFRSEEYLEMHMSVHLSDKAPANKQDGRSLPYTCLYCDRRFSRPHEKVKHERIHTGEKPHSCEICGKSFRVSYCLTLHMRTHTGARPYSCQHCGKRFKAHSVYNHHLLTHSDVRAYKCPYCPKAFKTSVQLAGHKNSHTKPFSCQQCNRPFASLYAVRMHQETHARQNGLKFSCSLCGASYARAFALKDHIKAVHSKEADKVEIDKALDLVLIDQVDQKGDQSMTTIVGQNDDWSVRNGDDTATEEVTIDAKNLNHEVDMNDASMINHNFSNELIVP